MASLYFFRMSAHEVLHVLSVSAALPARSTRAVNVSMTSMSANPAGRRGGGIGIRRDASMISGSQELTGSCGGPALGGGASAAGPAAAAAAAAAAGSPVF